MQSVPGFFLQWSWPESMVFRTASIRERRSDKDIYDLSPVRVERCAEPAGFADDPQCLENDHEFPAQG